MARIETCSLSGAYKSPGSAEQHQGLMKIHPEKWEDNRTGVQGRLQDSSCKAQRRGKQMRTCPGGTKSIKVSKNQNQCIGSPWLSTTLILCRKQHKKTVEKFANNLAY